MIELQIFILGIICGAALGAWYAWQRWLKKERPVLKITVDRDVLSMVTQEMAMDWAERRGLTWMPKGAVFDHGKAKEK